MDSNDAGAQKMGWHSIALLGYDGPCEEAEERVRFAGSGTLVESDGKYFILTAQHVWTEALAKFENVCVSIRPQVHRYCWPRKHLNGPSKTHAYSSVGPDICFLGLPEYVVPKMQSGDKFFYNLGKRRSGPLWPASGVVGDWAIAGAPGELTTTTGVHVEGQIGAFRAPEPKVVKREEWDFLEFILSKNVIRSYDGLSGGGVWWVWTGEDGTAQIELEGVAFYQEFEGNSVKITCHGRDSVYRALSCALGEKK